MHPKAGIKFLLTWMVLQMLQVNGATAPPFRWIKTVPEAATITDIAADGFGNCYVALGASLPDGPLTLGSLTATGTCVVAKCASDGTWKWARGFLPQQNSFGRLGSAQGGGCYVAAAAQNLGQVLGGMYDPDGNLLWQKEILGGSGVFVGGVAVDQNGNAYIAGSLGFSTFVASLSPSGTIRWQQTSSGGSQGWENVAVNASGEVFVCGYFEQSFQMSGVSFVSKGRDDLLVAKFNSLGNLEWVKTAGGTGFEDAYAVAPSSSGGCWAAGITQIDAATIGGVSVIGGFIAKVDNQINAPITFGQDNVVQGLAIDSNGSIYTAETIPQTVNSFQRSNARVSCLNAQGVIQWQQTAGGPEYDGAYRISVDRFGQIFVCGTFQQTATFGPFNLTASQVTSPFFTMLSAAVPGPPPSFVQSPSAQTLDSGATLHLSVQVIGAQPLSIEWIKDGRVLPAQTSTDLIISNAVVNDSGEYWAIATNAFGKQESGHALVSIIQTPPDIPVQVTTIAGSGLSGYLDATAPLAAEFAGPDGGAVSMDGVIYFGDGTNQVIRYILPNGEVGTFAGTPMVSGYREDVGTNALFNLPLGLQIDPFGDLLVADYGNHRVRNVLGLGYRSTSLLAGDGTPGLKVGVRSGAEVNGPNDVVALNGRIYFTEFFNHTVRSINSTGLVTVLAGSGVAGFRDDQGAAAQLNGPAGITTFGGNLYVTDWGNNRVRKVTTDGVVTTIAGSGALGFKSGLGTAAELGTPNGICADDLGNLYFTEYANSAVRRIDTNGWVSTLAGTGAPGFADGDRTQAMFNRPGGICMHPDGSLIVMDTYNYRIRRIVMDGKTNGWMRTGGFLTADLHPTLKVFGNVGERYRIETRDRLGQSDWSAVTSIVLEQSPTIWVDERPDEAMQRIYRAVKE